MGWYSPSQEDAVSEFFKRFGACVRRLRKQAGLSQEELGKRSGMDYKYVGEVERGMRNITLRNVERLCRALDAEPYELFLFTFKPDIVRRLNSILRHVDPHAQMLLVPLLRSLMAKASP
jgi:transcriptional regulator with XRE-family HTH domain